jgi:hypothetical protein
MKRRLFSDLNVIPTDALLRRQLGSAFQYYEEILNASGGFRRQWQFSRGNGWLLKVDDTRKALYYLIAFEDGVEVSLTVRDLERQHFKESPPLERLRAHFESATKYAEGWVLRFGVENAADCDSVAQFIRSLIAYRGSAPATKQKGKPPKSELQADDRSKGSKARKKS